MITFVLGGNKSGKSDYALNLLQQYASPAVFLATGRARDLSFRKQISDHRERRDPGLPVIEVGWDLPRALQEATTTYNSILVDSLDFWLFLAMQEQADEDMQQALLAVLENVRHANILLVSCEIGLTPLPSSAEARAFLKKLGRLNQAVAAVADEAYLVVAGLPLTLKKAENGN